MKTLRATLFGLLLVAPVFAAETPAPAARTIVLVRHGNYVADPAIEEKIGPALSPMGVAQAYLVGARLAALPMHFDGFYASPMQRAKNTAAVIATSFPEQKFETVDDLAECTPPTRRTDIMAREKPADLAACKKKLDRDFERFFKPATGEEQTDLLVCHGNVIRYLVTRALNVDSQAWLEMSVGHASMTTIRVEA
ncbi:MAG: histidine phosphatase family protein, partial [Dokdonella sp.]